jgi:hypothetical protein
MAERGKCSDYGCGMTFELQPQAGGGGGRRQLCTNLLAEATGPLQSGISFWTPMGTCRVRAMLQGAAKPQCSSSDAALNGS